MIASPTGTRKQLRPWLGRVALLDVEVVAEDDRADRRSSSRLNTWPIAPFSNSSISPAMALDRP